MKTKTIKQTVLIKSSPKKVYDTFMDEKKHRDFTGFDAKIENTMGGKFITCGNRNFGYTLFLKQGERIVQAWAQKNFPDNQYSIIDLKLSKTKDGYTKLTFHQLGAPSECVEWLIPGWKSTYWKPLKKYLEKGIIRILHK
jgi:uncharacterized protein YndB with AHSA1/START domain